jgi:hypothetical protein
MLQNSSLSWKTEYPKAIGICPRFVLVTSSDHWYAFRFISPGINLCAQFQAKKLGAYKLYCTNQPAAIEFLNDMKTGSKEFNSFLSVWCL